MKWVPYDLFTTAYLPKLVIVKGPYRTRVLMLGHIINIILSQAIAHANLHPHDEFFKNGHVQFFFPEHAHLTSIAMLTFQ